MRKDRGLVHVDLFLWIGNVFSLLFSTDHYVLHSCLNVRHITTILSFSVTLNADSCYAGILRFVLVVDVLVEVVIHSGTTTSTNTNRRIPA